MVVEIVLVVAATVVVEIVLVVAATVAVGIVRAVVVAAVTKLFGPSQRQKCRCKTSCISPTLIKA